VRRFMDAQGIELPMKDIRRDPDARRELLEAGGKTQVPALMIDGQVLYESNDIIDWLAHHIASA
jgi:glutathione S-transferase